jgi:predicted AAA+ superfamily ATPase
MYRAAIEQLISWKESKRRKPLILQGARQVGKTWLLQEFGKTYFRQLAYVSFMDNEGMRSVFAGSLEPGRLLDAVAIETGITPEAESTLIVFDEVQECPRALTSLKMFQERCPQYAIVAAGSLLGIAMHQGVSFPVGKVDHMSLYPLTFCEFLTATGNKMLAELLAKRDFSLIDSFKEKYVDALKRYYYIGGMPEVVQTYIDEGDYHSVREVQKRLLYDYEHDFSKYASAELSERIRLVWNSVPSQLARENKKFVYTTLRAGARARNFEIAIQWLVDAGLMLRVHRVSKPGKPLSGYRDINAFKLYLLDVGLLGAISNLDVSVLLEQTQLFEEFKGSLTEQYVCQELVATRDAAPYYWSAESSSGEIDFLYEDAGKVIPVEVKAEENLRSKSLGAFCRKYGLDTAVRFSLADYREQDWMTNIPLYAVSTSIQLASFAI